MKKHLFLLLALFVNLCAFAAKDVVPSDAVLADYYDQGDVCLCFFVPADMNCNNIVVTGSFNGWSSKIGDCVKVEAVEGYDGWYVASFEPEAEPSEEDGICAKPIMTDVDGNFNWLYQVGAATAIRGGVQVVQSAYAGEIDLKHFGTDAPNVFTVDAWKNNPCTIVEEPNEYVIVAVKLPDENTPAGGVEIIGGFDGWVGTPMELLETGWYFIELEAKASQSFTFRSAGSWNQEIEIYNAEDDTWTKFVDYKFQFGDVWEDDSWKGEPCKWVELDLTDPEMYRWTCEGDCKKLSLTVISTPDGVGTVTGSGVYENKTEVEISATPNYGYHFVQWSDGNTDNPRVITLTQDTTFIAEFAINTYKVSVTCDSIKGSVEGPQGEFEYLTELKYTATPKYGYHFDYWEGHTFSPHISVAEAESIASSLPSDGAEISERYIVEGYVTRPHSTFKDSYYISDDSNGESNCIIYDYDLSAKVGQKITIEGVIANYYDSYGVAVIFVSNNTTSYNPVVMTVMRDIILEAFFVPNQYTINGNITANGYISGLGTFEYLTECSIEAIPDYGYHFVQWSDGVTDNPRVITLTQDTTFIAELAADTNGQCGDSLFWSLKDSVLTIVGNGDMWNQQPWSASREFITIVNLPDSLTSIGEGAFNYCRSLTSIEIPDGVIKIEGAAFYNCTRLESIAIPNGVITIGEGVFYNCTGLTYMTIGNSVTSIGNGAFYNCTSLTSVKIPDSVNIIGNGAFSDCTDLTSVSIGKSVTSIGNFAFSGCKLLEYVTNRARRPQNLASSTYVFEDVDQITCTLYVPEESIELYKRAPIWQDFYIVAYNESEQTAKECNVIYLNKDNNEIDQENIKFHFPDAPEIDGFTFLGWQPIAAIINDEIKIQAIYKSNEESAPSVYTNPSNPAQKLIRQGNVYILTGDKTYTVTGQEVR